MKKVSTTIRCIALLLTRANSATVPWTGGPEDTFFCGYKWDEGNCLQRQHCPSGRNEECEFHAEGQKCFANSPCDARYGDGSGWVPGKEYSPPMNSPSVPLTPRPTYTGVSDDPTDHNWCGVGLDEAKTCVQHCPSGKVDECPQGMICFPDITQCDARNIVPDTMRPTPEITPAPTMTMPPFGGPTPIPTDMPIGPPDPLPFPSDDPTDHWFCGIGLDDANEKCKIHCPSASECPVGQICYFGTTCDGRTFAPTPPPTHRPTKAPTNHPTNHPTNSMPPSFEPTTTPRPSVSPSLPIPTRSPTKPPTGRPTWAPLPALQLTFFCGADWNDAISGCKKRCPTGEDTECPDGEFCFTGTPCTEEMGYPETDDATDDDSQGQACKPFQVTITADAWPNEISWVVNNTETEELVAKGGNDELVAGEAYDYPVECINYKKGCYEFTIIDSGGDGLCCGEGQGSYTISYEGKQLKTGGAFYDYETTPFGLCGATLAPTNEPTIKIKEEDRPSGAAVVGPGIGYRCVDKSLAERGYKISADKCSLFDNCFNPQIKVGDDWFCDESSTCIEATACGVVEVKTPSPVASADVESGESPSEQLETEMTPSPANATSSESENNSTSSNFTRPPKEATSDLGQNSTIDNPGNETLEPESATPTLIPTTSAPTLGPCMGEPCGQRDHCRSRYGFCGPNPTYCNEFAVWTKDCPDKSLTSTPTVLTGSPSASGTTSNSSAPTKKKFVKPGGGKGSITKPARTHPPTEPHPYFVYPNINQPKPTENPIPPQMIETETQQPSPYPVHVDATTLYPTFENGSSNSDSPTYPSALSSLSPSRETLDTPVLSGANQAETPEPSEVEQTPSPADNSNEPTPPPSVYTAVTSPPTASTTSKATNEFTCTGDRCPVDSQCRSRYGTCGPGFIYCNVYSTWDSTCPPPMPGVTPTRSPTTKPTSDVSEINITPSLLTEPTLPPIPRPTLMAITESMPFNIQDMSMPGSDFDLSFTESDRIDDDNGTDDYTVPSEDKTDNTNPLDKFQTAEYLDLWANIAASGSSKTFLLDCINVLLAVGTAFYLLI